MATAHKNSRLAYGLLAAVLGGLVVGLPLLGLVVKVQADSVLMAKSVEVADGEALGFEAGHSDSVAVAAAHHRYPPLGYRDHVMDGSSESAVSIADGHLQRGPPAR